MNISTLAPGFGGELRGPLERGRQLPRRHDVPHGGCHRLILQGRLRNGHQLS